MKFMVLALLLGCGPNTIPCPNEVPNPGDRLGTPSPTLIPHDPSGHLGDPSPTLLPDAGSPCAKDMAQPSDLTVDQDQDDNDDSDCDHPTHGKGRDHCKGKHKTLSNGHGHNCKFDCED